MCAYKAKQPYFFYNIYVDNQVQYNMDFKTFCILCLIYGVTLASPLNEGIILNLNMLSERMIKYSYNQKTFKVEDDF